MARKRLIIHIGMHKTGSTSIQRFLSRNRLALRLAGVLFPESRGANGRREPKHNALFTAISHEADHGAPHAVLGPSAGLVEAVGDEIARSGARTAILSAEGFSGEKPDFSRALAPLGRRFDVRVIVFLRRQDEWLESFYRQMILSREVREARPLEAFLACPATQAHLDYCAMLDWWADAFGADALRPVEYHPEPGWNLVGTFLSAAGLSPRLALLPYGRARENTAPSNAMLEARWKANGAKGELRTKLTPDERREMATRLIRTYESRPARAEKGNFVPPFVPSMLEAILAESRRV